MRDKFVSSIKRKHIWCKIGFSPKAAADWSLHRAYGSFVLIIFLRHVFHNSRRKQLFDLNKWTQQRKAQLKSTFSSDVLKITELFLFHMLATVDDKQHV